jgi:hypothetical protein
MGTPFPLPAGVTNTNVAYFYANNTNRLGVYIKQVNDLSLISVDYSQVLPAVTPGSIQSFIIDAGGNPPLWVSNPGIVGEVFTFLISNGLAGQQYNLSILMNMAGGGIRTDILTVNIPSTDNDVSVSPGSTPINAFPNQGVVSADGSIYYNQVLRWFLSSTPPVNPNVMDQWFNTASNQYFQYTTNGVSQQWTLNVSLLDPNIQNQFNLLILTYFASLPVTQPTTVGQLWWDGGVLSKT